jgi:hypothetical protein
MYWIPGPDNSSLINTEYAVPTSPENNANIRYSVPMSFALQDKNHLSCHILILSILSLALRLIWFIFLDVWLSSVLYSTTDLLFKTKKKESYVNFKKYIFIIFIGKTYNIYKYPNNVHVYLQIKRAQKSYTKYKQEIKIYVKIQTFQPM